MTRRKASIDELVAQLTPLRRPATDSKIAASERALGVVFPDDYKAFLRRSDGFEGWSPGAKRFVQLARVKDLPKHRSWGGEADRPGLVWFGGDGGGEGFFFDFGVPSPRVLMIAYISDWNEDAVWHGDSSADFLDRIVRGWDPLSGPGARQA